MEDELDVELNKLDAEDSPREEESAQETISEDIIQVDEPEYAYRGVGRLKFFVALTILIIVGGIIYGLTKDSKSTFLRVLPVILGGIAIFFLFFITMRLGKDRDLQEEEEEEEEEKEESLQETMEDELDVELNKLDAEDSPREKESAQETISEDIIQVDEPEYAYRGAGRLKFFVALTILIIVGGIIYGLTKDSKSAFLRVLPVIWGGIAIFFLFFITIRLGKDRDLQEEEEDEEEEEEKKEESLKETTSERIVRFREPEDTYKGVSRLRFSVELAVLSVVSGVVYGLTKDSENTLLRVLPIIWGVIFIFLLFLVTQSRLVNIGYSQWWALLLWVPIYNLFLISECIILPEEYESSQRLDDIGIVLLVVMIVLCLVLTALIIAIQ